MSRVSVIGLGNMGTALAATLLQAGYQVTVWNRSVDKAARLAQAGATLAPTSQAAIEASDLVITCLKSHHTTIGIVEAARSLLANKTVLELSTGEAGQAVQLVDLLIGSGAHWQIGMINAYPSGIGKPETAILCAGPQQSWAACEPVIRVLGGASDHVGTQATTIAGLFAAMFTARQGFMFGLIYGGAVCKKSGVPLEVFARQVPVTLGMAGNYADLFVRTVPPGEFDNPSAPVSVYLDSLDDVMATFQATGCSDALPRLMRDLARRAVDSGLAGKELTTLVEMIADDDT